MGIFRRPRDSSSPLTPAIAEFWEWWEQARPSIEAMLTDGLSPEIIEETSRRIHKIHSGLQWEIGQDDGTAVLTVTGGGNAELRGLAERWRRAAPRTAGWEYHAARQADPEMLGQKLSLGDHELDLEYVQLGMRADQTRARIHITAYHPDFLFLPEETRLLVASNILDWALGEDDVARWVGDVKTATEPPMDALPPSMLSAVAQQIAEPFLEPTWLTGEGRTPRGHPALVGVRFPLHRQDHPLCDLHVAVSVPYAHSNPDRLPVEPSASALRKFEKRLTALGAGAVLAVRETGDGLRVFHLYADPDSGVLAEFDQLAASWSEGRAKVASTPDPGWRALAPYQP